MKQPTNKHIYEYFKCQSMEELVDKVIDNDPTVQPLTDFLNHLQEQSFLFEGFPIDGHDRAIDRFIDHECLPTRERGYVMCLNSSGDVTSIKAISAEDLQPTHFFKTVLKESSERRGILLTHADTASCMQDINNYQEITDFMLVDELQVDDDGIIKGYHQQDISRAYPMNNEHGWQSILEDQKYFDRSLQYNSPEFTQTPDFDQFTEFYCREKMKTLNMVEHEDEIDRLLKLDMQFSNQEMFKLVTFDKDLHVNHYETLSVGGVNSTVVPNTLIASKINTDQTESFMIAHNHPSGSLSPSEADKEITKKMLVLGLFMGKNLFDSKIVSTTGVYNLSDEMDYVRSMREQCIKNSQSEYQHLPTFLLQDDWEVE